MAIGSQGTVLLCGISCEFPDLAALFVEPVADLGAQDMDLLLAARLTGGNSISPDPVKMLEVLRREEILQAVAAIEGSHI